MFSNRKKSEIPFFIAEVGQNHQGSLDTALEYIRVFSAVGADAVKFQTRNNKYLFDLEAYGAHYDSENAFDSTYGLHREKLELKPEWLPVLKNECDKHNVKFMSTPFDEPSLELLTTCNVDILKVASFDIGNLPFINKIALTKIPVVMSVGGGKIDQIKSSVDLILKTHSDLALLHCVSEYPCEHNRLGLSSIKTLSEQYPSCLIGSSDHFSGILSGPVAYMQGARIFEKHVTLNRSWKGSDHSFALEPEGFRKFVRDTNRTREMLPSKPTLEIGQEAVFKKLGKSIIAKRDLKAGEILDLENLSGKIFRNQFIPVRESNRILGRKIKKNIKSGSPLTHDDLL